MTQFNCRNLLRGSHSMRMWITLFPALALAEGGTAANQDESDWGRKVENFLPDTLGYALRYSILGFSIAKGGKVDRIAQVNKTSPYLTNWGIYRSRDIESMPHWNWGYSLAPYFSSYYLSQRYEFNLTTSETLKSYRSQYRIELWRLHAFVSLSGEYRMPYLALQAGIGAGPALLVWNASSDASGEKIELSWGPTMSAWIFFAQDWHVKFAWEVFSVTQNRPIGTASYFVNAYQYTSATLGWRFRN